MRGTIYPPSCRLYVGSSTVNPQSSDHNNQHKDLCEKDVGAGLEGAVGGVGLTTASSGIGLTTASSGITASLEKSVIVSNPATGITSDGTNNDGIELKQDELIKSGSETEETTADGIMRSSENRSVGSSEADAMAMEEGSIISVDSDLFDRSSFNAKSVLHEDGNLNHDNIMSWTIPQVDTSRLKKLAATSFLQLNLREKTSYVMEVLVKTHCHSHRLYM